MFKSMSSYAQEESTAELSVIATLGGGTTLRMPETGLVAETGNLWHVVGRLHLTAKRWSGSTYITVG